MKNLIILLVSFFSIVAITKSSAQPSNPVSRVLVFNGDDIIGIENAVTVPEGKFWTIKATRGVYKFGFPNQQQEIYEYGITENGIPENFKLYESGSNYTNPFILIYEHNLITDTSMGYNSFEQFRDKIKLFPNPTTSEVAFNSEKTYEIQVFDILGNKVVELVGNSINMEHLSNATYVVKALDVETQESLSYKVIKK